MDPGKLTSELGESNAKLKERDRKITTLGAEIRRLSALLAERDSGLRKLRAELAKCDATIRIFTVELGERHTKIGELTADVEIFSKKIRQHEAELEARDSRIRENEAEIRHLKQLLEEKDSAARKLREELEALKERGAEELPEEMDEEEEEVEKEEEEVEEEEEEVEKEEEEVEEEEVEKEEEEVEKEEEEVKEEEVEKEEEEVEKEEEEVKEEEVEKEEEEVEKIEEMEKEKIEEKEEVKGEVDKNLEELRAALGARDARIEELQQELDLRHRELAELNAELEESRIRIWQCLEEHRKDEERVAHVTLDPLTCHPRLLLSPDGLAARWAYGGPEPSPGPERFTAAPCALGSPAFSCGRHTWTVSLARGPFCAAGVSLASVPRHRPGFGPGAGVWAVQRWGGLARALSEPPTPLPRLPRRLRVALDCDRGLVAFFDADGARGDYGGYGTGDGGYGPGDGRGHTPGPLFTFRAKAMAGQSVRPWFWVELGSISIEQ